MITITCCNKSCPKGKFDWNVSIDCMPAKLEDPKAVLKKAFCPHCNQLNWIVVKCKRERHITKKERRISNITINGRHIRYTRLGRRYISSIDIRGRRRSNSGRRRRQLRRGPQQSEDPGDHGPHKVPVAMTIKGYENRTRLKHER